MTHVTTTESSLELSIFLLCPCASGHLRIERHCRTIRKGLADPIPKTCLLSDTASLRPTKSSVSGHEAIFVSCKSDLAFPLIHNFNGILYLPKIHLKPLTVLYPQPLSPWQFPRNKSYRNHTLMLNFQACSTLSPGCRVQHSLRLEGFLHFPTRFIWTQFLHDFFQEILRNTFSQFRLISLPLCSTGNLYRLLNSMAVNTLLHYLCFSARFPR